MIFNKPNNDLLLRYFSGNCTDEERREVSRWSMENDENEKIFGHYKLIWELSEPHRNTREPDLEEAWEDLNRRIYYAEQFVPVSSFSQWNDARKFVPFLLKIAAVFLIAFGLVYLFTQSPQVERKQISTVKVLKTPFVLPDQSKVYLGSRSNLVYPEEFASHKRVVGFQGEALFQVSHNPDKPFIVQTGNVRVKVLGTVFDLRNKPQENEITIYLKSGKVLFYSVDNKNRVLEQIILHPGEKGIYNKSTATIVRSKFDNDNFLAWKTGNLRFIKAPLPEVFQTLEKTFNIKIISEISCDNLRVTARYTNETPQSVFEALHLVFGFNYKITGQTVRIY